MSASFSSTSTTVLVEGLHVSALVGYTSEERARPQTVIVDIVCELNTNEFGDELARTFDYVPIVEQVRLLALVRERALIETFAEEIATACFSHAAVERARVSVRKPHKLMGCVAVGVERIFVRKTL